MAAPAMPTGPAAAAAQRARGMNFDAHIWSDQTHFVGYPHVRISPPDGYPGIPQTPRAIGDPVPHGVYGGNIRPRWKPNRVPAIPPGLPGPCLCKHCNPPAAPPPLPPAQQLPFDFMGLPLVAQRLILAPFLHFPNPIQPIINHVAWAQYHINLGAAGVGLQHPNQHALLQISRAFHHIAADVYYSLNTFEFREIQDLGQWLLAIGPLNCARLRRIAFNWWDRGTNADVAFTAIARQCTELTSLEIRIVHQTFVTGPPRARLLNNPLGTPDPRALRHGAILRRRVRFPGQLRVTHAPMPAAPAFQPPHLVFLSTVAGQQWLADLRAWLG